MSAPTLFFDIFCMARIISSMMTSTPLALTLGRSFLPFTIVSRSTLLISVLYIVNTRIESIIITISKNCD